MENNVDKNELVLVYLDTKTNKFSLREMHKEPTQTDDEELVVIVEFQIACMICNRLNKLSRKIAEGNETRLKK